MKKRLLLLATAIMAMLGATAQCSMKRRFLQTVLVGWCLLSAAPVAAQVFYAPPIFGGNVIVRSIDRDMRLVYTDGPVGTFSLITPVDTLYFYLPTGLVIKDMEVANGWAFFCGTWTGSGAQDGVVGQFRIFDVFAGTGAVNYAVFDTTSSGLTSYFFKTLSFDRLDVFFPSVNDPYIALIGDITCDTINPATSLRKTVACAYYNGSRWYLEVVCNKNDYVQFMDIACLGNAIYAIGRTNHHDLCVAPFRQQPFFTHLPYNSSSVYVVTNVAEPLGDDGCVITKTMNDYCIVAHHSKRTPKTVFNKLHFVSASNPVYAYLPATKTIPAAPNSMNPYDPWALYDIRFSNSTGKAYLLETADHSGAGTFDQWLLGVSAVGTDANLNANIPYVSTMTSVDVDKYELLPMLGGYLPAVANRMIYSWPFDPTASGICRTTLDVHCVSDSTSISERVFEYPCASISKSPTIIANPIMNMSVIKHCY